MLTKKDKTKLAGFYNYHAEKENNANYIEWDQEEYETTIDMLETHNKYLYEKLQEADERINKAIKYIKEHSNCGGSVQEGKFIIEHIEEIYDGMKLLDILRGEDDE